MAKTLSEMELLEKRNSELEKKSEQMLEKAKEQIKKGNKQNAKTCMLKRKNYLKFLETSQNTLNILEKQIFDLKNAESNANFADILKQTVEVGKQYSATADEFADVADDIKDQKDAINEIQSGIKDLALNTVDDDELDKELEELGKDKEEKKEEIEIFPSANNENIDDEKIFEELVKEDNKQIN